MSQRLVLGFHQNPVAAAATIAHLRHQRYTRSALIQKSPKGKLSVDNGGVSPRDGALAGGAVVPLAAILIHSFFPAPLPALVMAIGAVIAGAGAGALFARWLVPGVSRRLLAKYKRRLIDGEALVMVQVSIRSVGKILALLDKSEGAQAITFVVDWRRQPDEVMAVLRSELLPVERLQAVAAQLAAETRTRPAGSAPVLFKRLRDSSRILKSIHRDLLDAAGSREGFSLSSEWLLDNAYVIQGQIDDVWRNLPRRFYAELPAIASGRHAGLPRVYRIATELIDNTGDILNRAEISSFLSAFQQISPLTIGELWALPMMLRLALVERLRHLVIAVDVRQREAGHAEFWAHRLLSAARRDSDSVLPFLADLAGEFPAPTAHLADELIARLSDEETVLAPVRGWLERKLEVPLAEALQEEQRRQTADQVLLGNAISTLRQLTQLDWREVFESASGVDALLTADPVYTHMDFATRDCYRHEIERIARRSNTSELDVARHAVDLAMAGSDELNRHVGFYLLDNGRPQLEARVHCKPPVAQRLRRWSARRPALAYVGCIALTTLALGAGVIAIAARAGTGPVALALLAALMLLPASEIALQIVNYALTLLLTPRILPKMSFEAGIPDEFGTLVVVPIMLLTPMSVREQIERLEIRYLGNSDANLRFALFSDFSDAPSEHMPEDAEWLELVARHIEDLNLRHGAGRFFWFNRERRWSESEGRWIGWERKRGKLEQLNRFLAGDTENASLLRAGDSARLRGIRFVITLDADTQLPMNSARRMVETLAHPLNRPHLAADARRVVRGYGIIQPRVSTSLPSAMATLFARCFTNPTGTDPYSHAVSDVYQDLASEGNYHGKGIYDLEAFHRVLSGRFPEAHLLSHDLLEGAFVRVGLASDIELFDQFPADYQTYARRGHRWIRGDWQIADWLLRSVPTAGGRERNPLSAINRWKILDNLRRSLVPIASLALLLCGWLLSATPALWTTVIAAAFLVPPFLSVLNGLASPATLTFARWRDSGRDLLRALALLALLPHQAVIALDAIVRVWYRRLVSHRLLLQWDSAQTIERRSRGRQYEFLLKMAWVTTAAAAIALQINLSQAGMQFGMQAFALLWLAAPLVVIGSSRGAWHRPARPVAEADCRTLRLIARRTWRYFDDFVNAQSNWLPPDNYQEFMLAEIAQRTSPTNIGFGLLANLAARDFGYITTDDALARTQATLDTLTRLERFEGHLLNWYSTATLEPLHPRYVSMVDSGNLLAACWTVQQGYEQLLNSPVIAPSALAGLADVLALIAESSVTLAEAPGTADESSAEIEALHALTVIPRQPLEEIVRRIALATRHAEALARTREHADGVDDSEQVAYWPQQLVRQANAWQATIEQYLPWVQVLAEPPPQGLLSLGSGAHEWRRFALAAQPSLRMLASGSIPGSGPLLALQMRADELDVPQTARDWLARFAAAVASAQRAAALQVTFAEQVIARIGELADAINMRFLYRAERKLFAIGYNVSDLRLDNSYYDLLASEARLGSFVAIARGDVPAEHWWALGRPYASAYGRRTLLSWSGTMFEYLMPLLMTRSFKHSLLDRACAAAVASQIDYGGQRGIPWGISEAAFSALDAHQIYQYRAFGVPGLGLKRGLEEDLVVSPYSSALALPVAPAKALENLRRLAGLEPRGLLGDYGFFESIDYSRQRDPRGARGVPVHAYMAHHQGMILAALDNVLHDNIMPARFHADNRVRAAEPLLFERIPQVVAAAKDYVREAPLPRLLPITAAAQTSRAATPDTSTPKVHLLSNGTYSVMVTNAGGGYSRFRDIDITRWRADTTRDCWGTFIYLKAMRSGRIWSATHQPIASASARNSVSFNEDKAEFVRRDDDFDTQTEIVVSPEDNAEIRRLTLINHSSRERVIEVTSYAEIVLAAHNADRAHPAFNNLFVETEALPHSLLAWRRAGSPNDAGLWAAHTVSPAGAVQFETAREAFIGRGRTLDYPRALERALTGTAGTVLDPVFSLRRRVTLAGNARAQVSFVTAVADSREQALAIAQKYADTRAIDRAFELAWTHTQLEMRRLRIQRDDSRWFEELAGHLLYPHAQLRPPADRLRRNALGQSGLWAHGISGDLPIVVVTIGDAHDIDLVSQTLTAWNYLRLRGLKTDLVILNEEAASYEQTLHERLRRLTQGQPQGAAGNVFLLAAANLPERDFNLLLAGARVVLVAARGSLRKQLATPAQTTPLPPLLTINQRFREEPSPPLPYLELPYFNGLGGFTQDGREYVIYLGPNVCTPAPWVNVMANANFGALVSESGNGFSWYGNSQSNRLTPWANDAVADPAGDAIYIRDDDMGVYWTPTASPIRELDAYRARHGQGYSVFEHNSHAIEQELLTFVPVDDSDERGDGAPLRIQKLHLRNVSTRVRRLSVTLYAEWVLGAQREETQQHVISNWDSETQALLARNVWQPDFAARVAFAACSPAASSYTADRGEFIGRNGSLAAPAALSRTRLSRSSGAGLDPCAALQVRIELDPGQEVELVFLLGQGENSGAARELIKRYRDVQAVAQALTATRAWWDRTLGAIEVETPDLALNFLLNRWLLYQDLSCRIWGRSAFYQAGGAYGFRDQLQDVLAVVYAAPRIARAQILCAASRQFHEGDVQHWWHSPSGAGVRTRISDDLLWLPYATAQYVRVTGDDGILDEVVPFLEGAILRPDEHDKYFVPSQSAETASLLEHCRRAVEKGATEGAHGLPLIGGGDWNDGMNRVGAGGQGESVWLAWFLVHVLHDWAYLAELHGDEDAKAKAKASRARAARLAQAIERHAWDGSWYLRAFFDDGSPLGSARNDEAKIDTLAQSWAVISGVAEPGRAATALNAAEQHLVRAAERMVLLFAPPFDKTPRDPGYIKSYPPGVRENGGQYTHGSLWLPMAFARQGDGDKASALLQMMNPVEHARTPADAAHYKVEPYVVAADVYALAGKIGRGGWSWYTGSAGWMYRIWVEEVLGFRVAGDRLSIDPVISSAWPGFLLRYRYGETVYEIVIENPQRICRGVASIRLDGRPLPGDSLALIDDHARHSLIIRMGLSVSQSNVES